MIISMRILGSFREEQSIRRSRLGRLPHRLAVIISEAERDFEALFQKLLSTLFLNGVLEQSRKIRTGCSLAGRGRAQVVGWFALWRERASGRLFAV